MLKTHFLSHLFITREFLVKNLRVTSIIINYDLNNNSNNSNNNSNVHREHELWGKKCYKFEGELCVYLQMFSRVYVQKLRA